MDQLKTSELAFGEATHGEQIPPTCALHLPRSLLHRWLLVGVQSSERREGAKAPLLLRALWPWLGSAGEEGGDCAAWG